jgi:hypothetical protein
LLREHRRLPAVSAPHFAAGYRIPVSRQGRQAA